MPKSSPPPPKDVEIRCRGTRLDDARLAALAKHYETNVSATMRRLIAEKCTELGLKVKV